MKLKLDANGNAVLQDGKPVYILDDGREVAHDAAATVAKISSLNGEAMSHRQAKRLLKLRSSLSRMLVSKMPPLLLRHSRPWRISIPAT